MPGPRYTRRELLAGAAALAIAPAALAQSTSRYAVELLVFRQPGTPPPAPTTMTTPLAAAPPGPVEPLPQEAWQLQNLAGGLRRSGGYRVLGYGAWIATVRANGSLAVPVESVMPGSGLTGAVTVQRGQFLFLRVELDYATPEGRVYQLRERRRVKFNERHYFDHPALGAIAVISPLAR
jgi:glucose/arabinose dehydrogenase